MSEPSYDNNPTLLLYSYDSDGYDICKTQSNGFANAPLPIRQTVCSVAATDKTAATYKEPPFEVAIAIVVNSAAQATTATNAIAAINVDSTLLPHTELCYVTHVVDGEFTAAEMSTLVSADPATYTCVYREGQSTSDALEMLTVASLDSPQV